MQRGTVAVVGLGAMGTAVAKRLLDGGCSVAALVEGRSPASRQRLTALGVPALESARELAGFASLVLSIVPPGQARAAAQQFSAAFAAAPHPLTYVDCNAVAPATVGEIGAIVRAAGADFLDAGIIGGPPRAGESGPIFFVCGAETAPMLALREASLDVRSLGPTLGAASALKMSYSGITKGLTALSALMQEQARAHGLGAELDALLQETRPDLWPFIESAVPGMYPKAYRWIAEMREIAAYTSPDPAGTRVYEGAALLYERVANENAVEV